MKRILVTGYNTLDLDGSSCAFAYAELLRKQGKDATAGIFETLKKESDVILVDARFMRRTNSRTRKSI